MGMEIVTRAEAKARGLKRYFTGKPCKNGHISERSFPDSTCVACARERALEWQRSNPEKSAERIKKWKLNNQDKVLSRRKEYRDRNRDILRDKGREYVERNREKIYAKQAEIRAANPDRRREIVIAYARRNPEKMAYAAGMRRSALLRRTPKWADTDLIKFFYATRAYMSAETGSQWHVDHIVPLRGKTVSGLHNHFNMRVVPGENNMKKGNRFEQ